MAAYVLSGFNSGAVDPYAVKKMSLIISSAVVLGSTVPATGTGTRRRAMSLSRKELGRVRVGSKKGPYRKVSYAADNVQVQIK